LVCTVNKFLDLG